MSEVSTGDLVEIIFDVPNNIEARLGKVQEDIFENILAFKDKFQVLTETFATKLYEINQVRDIQLIQSEKRKIENYNNDISLKQGKITVLKTHWNKMQVFKRMNELLKEYQTEQNDLAEYDKLKKRLKGKNRPVTSVADINTIRKLEEELNAFIKTIQNNQSFLNEIFSNEKNRLLFTELIQQYEDQYNALFTYGIDKLVRPEDLIESIDSLVSNLPNIASRLIDEEKIDLLSMLENLIGLFEHSKKSIYEQLNPIIGDINVLTKALITERDKINENVVDYNSISRDIIRKLRDIKVKAKEILLIEKKLDKARKSHILTADERKLDEEFSKLKFLSDKLKKYPDSISKMRLAVLQFGEIEDRWVNNITECEAYIHAKRGEDVIIKYKNLPNYGIDTITKEMKDIDESITNIQGYIRSHQAVINDEMEKPEGRISDDSIIFLTQTRDEMVSINRSLNEYVGYLNGTFSANDIKDENASNLENFIGELIAESLNNVLPLDNVTHQIISYNYKENYFKTKDGNNLYLDYVSTGLSSASYLMHKIRSRQKKYQLILLDEVGNMSETSRQLVLNEVDKLKSGESLINLLMASVEDNMEFNIKEIL
jgi:hypothetical protein